MKKPTNDQIRDAIQTIIDAGTNAEYPPITPETRARAFGMGMAKVCDDVKFLIGAASEHCENWNCHEASQHLQELLQGSPLAQ